MIDLINVVNLDDLDDLEKQLIRHEGLKLKPYKCTAGKTTIGVGRNLDDKGISEDEAIYLLREDILECITDLYTVFNSNWHNLTKPRMDALIDLRFNLGPTRFRKFKKMILAVKNMDYSKAADEMKNSIWYIQVGQRGETLVKMMREG